LGSESSIHFWISGLEKGSIDSSSNLFMNGSVRAPIFYDSNDTGYYLDPNTTGLALRVNGNIECYARSAAWAEGYRVRVPSRATWGGIRFTRDEGNSNGNWAIGFTGIDSTDDLTFWGNLNGGEGMRARLTQGGVFSVAGDVRAPIFYDSNNTSFYIDPAGGSLINEIYNYGWYRSYGDTGWFSQSYGGGIYMVDTTWVRVYNGKAFFVANEIAATGNITAYYSDERLKTKTGGIDNALEKVVGLSGFLYVENELARSLGYTNEKQQVGVSAQAVQAVLPEAVSLAPVDFETLEDGTITSKSGENYLTVDYSRLVPLLIEAIKELSLKVKTLEEKDN
jgi:chaperonin cofactor prefoldin